MSGPEASSARVFSAVESCDVQAIHSLLTREPHLVNARGKVAHWSGECTPLQYAVEQGNEEMIRALLDRGADVNDKAGLTGWAPLHLALKNKELSEYLIERGALVDIHAAAGLGDLARVKSLVESDPTAVHWRGPDGATPLHFASTLEIAAFLLDRGADIEARDEEHNMTPLAWLAANREVAELLVARGASVSDPFLAAAVGDAERMRLYLDTDPALIRAATADGDYYGAGATLLHIAAGNGRLDVVKLLLARGAAVNAKGGWWNVTPLHWAAQHGWTEIARALLEHGADVSARDSEQNGTPLSWAEFFRQREMIELLKRYV